MEKLKNITAPILRFGMFIIFIWFGTQQLVDPKSFTAYVPRDIASLLNMSQLTIVYINGVFEVILSIFLLCGLFVRTVAGLLAFHMFSILLAVGYNQTGVRDFGLFIATLVVAINGHDELSIDMIMKKDKK